MTRSRARAVTIARPTPAARVVCGLAYRVSNKPESIASSVTEALQRIAKGARSQQSSTWGVFPVWGCDVVLVGFQSARTPRTFDTPWAIEPGATPGLTHAVTAYSCHEGASVGPQRDDRVDADCIEEFTEALAATEAWEALGATRLDATKLPGGADLDEFESRTFFLMTDDGRGADVVLGMSFWRAGDTYAAGRANTWTRAVGDGDSVRVVGVSAARVDRKTPLRVVPTRQGPAADALYEGIVKETRALLDSPRPFAWYFIADPEG